MGCRTRRRRNKSVKGDGGNYSRLITSVPFVLFGSAAAVKIVAVGDYTADAQRFAQGKPIELIHGKTLFAMVREGQTTTPAKVTMTTIRPVVMTTSDPDPAPPSNPICPKCGADMVQRSNRQTKDHFWGCTKYPACRGTRTA